MTDEISALEAKGKHWVIIFQVNKRAKHLPKTCQNCIHCKCKPVSHSNRAYRPWPDEYVYAPNACEECRKLVDNMIFSPVERFSFGYR